MLSTYEKFIGGAFVLIGVLLFLSNAGAANQIIEGIAKAHMGLFGTLQGRETEYGGVRVGGFAGASRVGGTRTGLTSRF